MPSTTGNKTSRDENKAMREYLELCQPWVFDLYTNHGVRFNDLYRALVHYRQPWVDTPKLRSAIERWKKNAEPGPWPSQQIPEAPGFVIPPPPVAPQNLLSRLRVTEPVPDMALASMSMTSLPTLPNQEMLRNADLSNSTSILMMGPGLPIPSNQGLVILSPDHGTQWQRVNHAPANNFGFQSHSQTIGPTTTKDEFMEDAGHGLEGSVCPICKEQVGLFCGCHLY